MDWTRISDEKHRPNQVGDHWNIFFLSFQLITAYKLSVLHICTQQQKHTKCFSLCPLDDQKRQKANVVFFSSVIKKVHIKDNRYKHISSYQALKSFYL